MGNQLLAYEGLYTSVSPIFRTLPSTEDVAKSEEQILLPSQQKRAISCRPNVGLEKEKVVVISDQNPPNPGQNGRGK